jgi:glyoxylase-like metal-dependent hydrolase (beta-lactamase superfamily II)
VESSRQHERLAHGVYLVPLQVSNCYIWESDGLLTVVDTGVPGSADAILAAVGAIGHTAEAADEIVLTHFYRDHTGSAADLVRHTGAHVVGHRADAWIIEGREPPPWPRLTQLERRLAEMLSAMSLTCPDPNQKQYRSIAWSKTASSRPTCARRRRY